jgi:hypothetical protein
MISFHADYLLESFCSRERGEEGEKRGRRIGKLCRCMAARLQDSSHDKY